MCAKRRLKARRRSSKPVDGTSLRAYARHRGVSAPAVLKAIRAGRLKESIARDRRGTPRIVDVKLADEEWARNTDLSKAPGYVKERSEPGQEGSQQLPAAPKGPSPLTEATTREKDARARLAELEYQRKAGGLINAKVAEDAMVDLVTRSRTKLLGVPNRLKQRHPELAPAVLQALDSLMREALEELATEGPTTNGAAA